MVYKVINVVSVYGPDTLHNRMSSAAVLISGHEKKKKKEKHYGCLETFWFGTSAMLFSTTGRVFVMKTRR